MNKPELVKIILEFIDIKNHKVKASEITKIRKMKLHELRKKITEFEKEAKLIEKEAKFIEENKCKACLKEQFIQQKINEKTYDQRLLANIKRELACKYCNHETTLIYDEDQSFCDFCKTLQNPSVSHEKYPH